MLLESGARVIAPDSHGSGRSDEPVRDATYTLHLHRDLLVRLVEHLHLHHTTLVGPHSSAWRSLVRSTPHLPVGQWIRDTAQHLTEQEAAAYDAPLPGARCHAGARTFPGLAMVEPEVDGVAESQAALRSGEWSVRSFMAVGANDPDVETMQVLRSSGDL